MKIVQDFFRPTSIFKLELNKNYAQICQYYMQYATRETKSKSDYILVTPVIVTPIKITFHIRHSTHQTISCDDDDKNKNVSFLVK